MDFPIWDIPYFGGGALVALIAVIHVYVAHFAVGGGLFLVLTERKAQKENNPAILEYCSYRMDIKMLEYVQRMKMMIRG